MNKSVKINVENIHELKKLIIIAEKQSKQLEDTISEINGFKLKITSQVYEKEDRASKRPMTKAEFDRLQKPSEVKASELD
nr:hypothetical protein CJ225_01110 [Gardnerella vaginalis]